MLKKVLIFCSIIYLLIGLYFFLVVSKSVTRPYICPPSVFSETSVEPNFQECQPQPDPSVREKISGALYLILFWPIALVVGGH